GDALVSRNHGSGYEAVSAHPPEMRYTSKTPSTLRTAESTVSRWLASLISNTNFDCATRAREVPTDAERIFTWVSVRTFVISESSPDRSRASTWIWTR